MVVLKFSALFYHHRQIGNMNHWPLFRVSSWTNVMGCMSFEKKGIFTCLDEYIWYWKYVLGGTDLRTLNSLTPFPRNCLYLSLFAEEKYSWIYIHIWCLAVNFVYDLWSGIDDLSKFHFDIIQANISCCCGKMFSHVSTATFSWRVHK